MSTSAKEENDSLAKLMDVHGLDRIWLGITDSETASASNEGTWVAMRDGIEVTWFNWHDDISFDGADHDCFGQDYSLFDHAQMWRVSADRRWHDANCEHIIPEAYPTMGEWVSIPDYAVMYSGAYLAHIVLEFPKVELEIVQGQDDDGNGTCDQNENYECLQTFSDVRLMTTDAGESVMTFNGHLDFDTNRIQLVGTGQYRLVGVPPNAPVRLDAEHPAIFIDTVATSYSTLAEDGNRYFHGNVEFKVIGDFNTIGWSSPLGDLGSAGRFHFQYPSDNFTCAGLCEDDDNFNYICDDLEGCTEPGACNYDASKMFDDGSCVDAAECTWCMDTLACNWDIDAIFPDNSTCIYPEGPCEECSGVLDGSGTIIGGDMDNDGLCDMEEGCTDPMACNFKLTAIEDPNNNFADGIFQISVSTSPLTSPAPTALGQRMDMVSSLGVMWT